MQDQMDMVSNPLDLILQTMHDLTVKIWYLPHHLYGSLFAKASVAEEGGGGGKSPLPLKNSRKQSKEGRNWADLRVIPS